MNCLGNVTGKPVLSRAACAVVVVEDQACGSGLWASRDPSARSARRADFFSGADRVVLAKFSLLHVRIVDQTKMWDIGRERLSSCV